MRNHFKLAIGIFSFLGFPLALAAQKQLPQDFVKRLSVFQWVDNTHYRTYVAGASGVSKASVIDVATGKEVVMPVAQRTANPVTVKRTGEVIIKLKTGALVMLTHIENPTLSPDSNFVAYTKAHDLYIFNRADSAIWRVTVDGSETIYNGYSSWVYNEEVLGRGLKYRAFWWSPDSKKVAFMRFDDTNVPIHYLTDDSGIHEKQIAQRYPLPGDPNPGVSMGVALIDQKKLVWAYDDPKIDHYYGAPIWTPNADALWTQWMNRGQDTLKITALDLASGKQKPLYTETQKTWISIDQENRITFVPGRKLFLLISDKDGWMHIYAHDTEGKQLRQLTKGNWSVAEINYVDEKNGVVFFTGNRENSTRTDLYKVKISGGDVQRLTFGPYAHRFDLSPDGKHFITTYGNFNTPNRVALLDNNGKLVRQLANSRGDKFETYLDRVTKSEIIRIKTPDGFELPVRITWPVGLDTNKKYPLLANVYGGPSSAMVSDGYYGAFADLDNPERELIRIQMDHRGSGQFGKVGQNYMYRDLGHWEVEDYKTVINYLKQKYPFIDGNRVGISGFSYGGYISALSLVKAPDVFTVALAGGSVTDWHLYDSIYTERYMDKPEENPKGYESSSILTYAKNLKGHLSLAQGTMDDNVHMRNTIKLVDALQEARQQFDVMFYPGAAHGWYYLPNKAAHYNQANQEFIKKYLLTRQN